MGQKCQKYFLESTYRKLSGPMQRSPYKIITDFGSCSCTNFSIKKCQILTYRGFSRIFCSKIDDFCNFRKEFVNKPETVFQSIQGFLTRILAKIEPEFSKNIFYRGVFSRIFEIDNFLSQKLSILGLNEPKKGVCTNFGRKSAIIMENAL